jgi:alkylation response protein AidB-like acyl-CoA dehydrogenase
VVDYEFTSAVTALRGRLRELVAEHVPDHFLGAFTADPDDLAITQRFCKILAAENLLVPAWPETVGGGGATIWEQTALREEMWAHHEPRGAQYMGVNWVGPAIMRHGTPEQQAFHLPAIAHGDVIWCQGFSEPDSGSDLASLRLAAVRDADDWRVSGQKIWTSYAGMAGWCFLLARTTRGENKHHGITVFLVPMDSRGIEVRPIESMLGPHHLNEVFFDDVVVSNSHVLGEVDQGWALVQEALAFERTGIARYARVEHLLQSAPAALGPAWGRLPPTLVTRWARVLMLTRRARLLAYNVVDKQAKGAAKPAEAAAYRVAVTHLDQESAEVLMDIVGSDRAITTEEYARFARAVDGHWRYSQASTLASGSTEMQRILLARSLGR